jgi:hypothetical protein
MTDVLVFTRPDGSQFSVNSDDPAASMVLSYPENRGAVQTETQPLYDADYWAQYKQDVQAGIDRNWSDEIVAATSSRTDLTPQQQAALHTAQSSAPSQSPAGTPAAPRPVYRMILDSGGGRVDTGATYPGCSAANPSACGPVQFASILDAVTYAYAHNEIPYMVASADEAFGIAEGRILPTPANIIPPPSGPAPGVAGADMSTLILAGLALLAVRGVIR